MRAVAYKDIVEKVKDACMAANFELGDDVIAAFHKAKEKEESKHDLLNKKFEWAKKNKDKLPEAPKPDIFWD